MARSPRGHGFGRRGTGPDARPLPAGRPERQTAPHSSTLRPPAPMTAGAADASGLISAGGPRTRRPRFPWCAPGGMIPDSSGVAPNAVADPLHYPLPSAPSPADEAGQYPQLPDDCMPSDHSLDDGVSSPYPKSGPRKSFDSPQAAAWYNSYPAGASHRDNSQASPSSLPSQPPKST